MNKTCCLAMTIALSSSLFAQSKLIHVPQDKETIQAAIDSAANGDTVLVAEGTYPENIRIRKKIVVASLFVLDGNTSHISATIINGSQPQHADTGSVVLFDTGADTSSILIGFTLTGGTGTQRFHAPSATLRRGGGGVFVAGGGATIRNNRIVGNSVSHTSGFGSGIFTFSETIPYVKIESNYIVSNSIALTTNRFGGAAVSTICPGYIANNIIAKNMVSSGPGQAVSLFGTGLIVFVNNTVALNFPLYGVRGMGIFNPNVKIMNNIFWNPGGGAEMVYFFAGAIPIKNNLIRGGFYGDNNLDADPGFADNVSFALSPSSPCISAGADTATILGGLVSAPSTDYSGAPRPSAAGSRPDLGAMESNLSTVPVPQESQFSFHMIGTRGYFVFLPKNYSVLPTVKLLMYLHGCGSGGMESSLFRFNEFADTMGFVAVYPSSVGTCWVDGVNGTSNTDVLFIDQLIDTLLANYKIDSTKIFLTGFSSGGFLAFRLAVESGHMIAGIAPFAASIANSVSASPPQKPVPMIYFQGTGDTQVLYSGTSGYLGVSQVLTRWASYNSCDTADVSSIPDVVATDQCTVEVVNYQGSPGIPSASIHFYKVIGGSHSLPGPYIGANLPVNRDIDGAAEIMKFFSQSGVYTSREETKTINPETFALSQNFPNPFNPSTRIQFSVVSSQFTVLKIFDLLGREVATLVNEVMRPGSYEVTWDARQGNGGQAAGLPSGVYFYTLSAGEFKETKRLLLLK